MDSVFKDFSEEKLQSIASLFAGEIPGQCGYKVWGLGAKTLEHLELARELTSQTVPEAENQRILSSISHILWVGCNTTISDTLPVDSLRLQRIVPL